MSPDLVTRTEWYRVPGRPLTVLTWVTEHCPSGLTLDGSSGMGWMPARCGSARQLPPQPRVPGMPTGMHFPAVWSDMFGNVDGELMVSVADDGPGEVAIRVDAQVLWLPTRLATERVPAAARVVTIAHLPGSGSQPAGDVPVTVTNPATVARIVAIVDGVPVFPPGVIVSCPLENGSGMQLTFRATLSGPALAVVTAVSGGCGSVAMTIGGRPMPTLGDAPSLQQQVAAAAGLTWPAGQVEVPTAPTTAAATVTMTAA